MALPLANPQELRETALDCSSAVAARMARGLQLWHLASLDAPTVAVVWAVVFAWALGVRLPSWVPLLLACGTWTVYVGDRLLDARRAARSQNFNALRERHFFHWRHRRSLIPLACASGVIAVALIAGRMPAATRNRDTVLAAAALVYFSGVHATGELPGRLQKLLSKELLVGLLFTAGCVAPAIARAREIGWGFGACLAIFVLLAWTNCCAIDAWESLAKSDRIFARSILLAIVATLAFVFLVFVNWRLSALACSAGTSAVLLALLDRKRNAISPITLRALADLALLTPAVAMLLGANNP